MWHDNMYFTTVSLAIAAVLIFFFSWKHVHRNKQSSAKSFRIKMAIGSVLCTLILALLQGGDIQSIIQSAVTGILITAAFGGLEKLIDAQTQAEETRRIVADTYAKLAESQLEPGRVQGLFDQINILGKKVDESSAQIRQASDRDANVTKLLEGLNTSLEVVNHIKNACLETNSRPMIYIANSFVQNFFGDRFKIGNNYQAVIDGRQTSIDAYKALWEFLIDEQEARERNNPIVVRALHSAPLSMWHTDPESGEGRRAEMLLNLQKKFVDGGGHVCRIVVNNRTSPETDVFKEQYSPILVEMQNAGIDIAYIYLNRKRRELPNFPKTGFIWTADFEYGQGWQYHKSTTQSTIVTSTKILWGKRHLEYADRWRKWKGLVDRMHSDHDSHLVYMVCVDFSRYDFAM